MNLNQICIALLKSELMLCHWEGINNPVFCSNHPIFGNNPEIIWQ